MNFLVLKKIIRKAPVFQYFFLRFVWLNRYVVFVKEFFAFRNASKSRLGFDVFWRDRYPCLYDNTGSTGFDRHYVFHTAWAARVVAKNKPAKHIDISSSLYFCSILSAFVRTEFYDYRPARLDLDNLSSDQGNLLQLPFEDEAIQSLSCMHVVEHIGLGRYGDVIDGNGDLRAISELKRVLAPLGDLIFVVPVGRPRVMFNAHRIYSYEQIVQYFSEFTLVEFSLIPDDESLGGLICNADPNLVRHQSYGCGCFWFKKPVN